MAIESVAMTLGTGSGIDVGALVTSLVEAQYAGKTAQLDRRQETLTAQISAASELKNAISGFASALQSLARGGTLSTQSTSTNTAIIRASTLTGGTPARTPTTIEVRQIAQAQAANTDPVADRTAPIGTGTLTLTFGTATVSNGAMTAFAAGTGTPVDITIDAASSSLDGIAAAINAKGAGVTASILSDSGGARLVLKGATGEVQAFTLQASQDSDPALSALNIGVGATTTRIGTTAQDAIVAVDGVEIRRASNTISNLIGGVKLDLMSAQPGTQVTIGTEPPTAALTQAVEDFVATFNELQKIIQTATNPLGGPLRSDTAASTLQRAMRQIVLSPLATGGDAGSPTTLAQIGVATNRDGSLRVDAAMLARAMSTDPAGVEAMFAGTEGLPARLSAIATAATDKKTGLGASEERYTDQQADLADDRAEILEATETLRTRMTRQFASMDAKVAAYKSTQSFLEQQIDAWNSQD